MLVRVLPASYLIAVTLSPHCSPEFVSGYINSAYGRQWVKSVVTQQVGQANVNGTKLAALAVPLPPAAEQRTIAQSLSEQRRGAFEQEQFVRRGLAQAAAQRKNILKAAFAGQLVPQNPNDETASALLARIRDARVDAPVRTRARKAAGSNPAPATNTPTRSRDRKIKEPA
jgi:type I restriction enzyme S subunit